MSWFGHRLFRLSLRTGRARPDAIADRVVGKFGAVQEAATGRMNPLPMRTGPDITLGPDRRERAQ